MTVERSSGNQGLFRIVTDKTPLYEASAIIEEDFEEATRMYKTLRGENFKTVELHLQRFPSLKYEVIVPISEDGSDKKGKARIRRSLSEHTFSIVTSLSGMAEPDVKPDLNELRKNSALVVQEMKDKKVINEEYSEFLKKSFNKKIRTIEKNLLKEEIQGGGTENGRNSFWKPAVDAINERFYGSDKKKVGRDTAYYEVIKIKGRVADSVSASNTELSEGDGEYLKCQIETHIANKITAELKKSNNGKTEEFREKGIRKLTDNVFSEGKEDKKPLQKFIQKRIDGFVENPVRNEAIVSGTTVQKAEKDNEGKISKEKFEDVEITEDIRFLSKAILQTQLLSVLLTLAASQLSSGNLSTPKLSVLERDDNNRGSEKARVGSVNKPKITPNPVLTPTPERLSNFPFAEKVVPGYPNKILVQAQDVQKTPSPEEVKLRSLMTPEPPYSSAGIDFSIPSETRFKIVIPDYEGTGKDLVVLDTKFTPIVHNDLNTPAEDQVYFESVMPGKNTSGVGIEKFGNTVLDFHSGRNSKGEPLEMEALRIFIQGGTPDHPEEYYSTEEQQRRIDMLKGARAIISKDGVDSTYNVVASGKIANGKYRDQFLGDVKDTLVTTIEATGGNDSSFYSLVEERGVIADFCLQNIEQKGKSPDWARWETEVLGLVPTDESMLANEKRNMEAKIADVNKDQNVRFAEIMARIVKDASLRVQYYDNRFESFIREQLSLYGVNITPRMEAVIRDTAAETSQGEKPQCMQGQWLLASQNPLIAEVNAWQIYDPKVNGLRGVKPADELLQTEVGVYDERLMEGNTIQKYDSTIIPVTSIAQFNQWDSFVVKANYMEPYGHVGVVIGQPLLENGTVYTYIFDINVNGDGRPRIVKVTDENMYQILAKLPEGEKGNVFAIRKNAVVASSNK